MTLELTVWLAAGLLGALVSAFNLYDAIVDRELAGRDDPREDWFAWNAIRREALRHTTLVLFTLAGVAALAGGPRALTVWLLVLGHALIAVNSLADRYERLRARRADWPDVGPQSGQNGGGGIE